MSEIKDIPKHWEKKKLGEVCGIVYGKGLPVKELKPSGFPVFGANGIIGFNDKYLFEEPQVLISCRGAASGKINLSPPKCYVTNNSLVLDIKQKNELDKTYLFYALNIANKTKLVTGTAQPQVTINNAVELDICYPPLPEQQAIVAKIEELLSELENGKQQLLTGQQQLKVYRQSLLKWAFEGLKEEKTVEEISEEHSIGLVKSSKEQNEIGTGLPYIKMNNVDLDGNVDFKKVVYVETTNEEARKYSLRKGDILINTRNSVELVGKTGIVREEKPNCVFNNNLLRVRTKKNYNSLFIGYQLISPWLRKQMTKEKKSTTNVCALYQRDIFPLRVKVTTLPEQQRIVDELESKLTVCDKIEETISKSLQQAETLRQSILKKAFEGKLININS
jgi:type I restriction enzyme S subunit